MGTNAGLFGSTLNVSRNCDLEEMGAPKIVLKRYTYCPALSPITAEGVLPTEIANGDVGTSATFPVEASRVYMERPLPHVPYKNRSLGSVNTGSQGFAKVTVVLGTRVMTPVVSSRTNVVAPYWPTPPGTAMRNGCWVCADAVAARIRKPTSRKLNTKRN